MARQPPPSARSARYRQIAEALRGAIRDGRLVAGTLLPSESELAAEHAVSRVTIRSALDVLRDEGMVQSRQGLGWTVSAAPLRQSLERLGTIEAMVAAAGRHGERRMLDVGTGSPPEWVAAELGSGDCTVATRLNLVDGRPFALVTVWCPTVYAAGLSRSDLEQATFLDQLPVAVSGATQLIGAGLAGDVDGPLLAVDEASPVLRVRRITRSSEGDAVLVSLQVFPAGSTEFVAELSVRSDPSVETAFRFVDPP